MNFNGVFIVFLDFVLIVINLVNILSLLCCCNGFFELSCVKIFFSLGDVGFLYVKLREKL